MNTKKYVITSLAVFIVYGVVDYIIHTFILASAYTALEHLWRPEMNSLMWLYFLVGLFAAFMFVYIFTKGYEGKGITEGLRFGVIIGLFVTIPSVFGQYFVYPLPFKLAAQWLIFGIIEFIIIGIIAAALYKPSE
jgi:hypothetical protein